MLKGSQKGITRHYCNTPVADFLARKLARGTRFTPEERRLAYLQLTDYYQLENIYEGLAELELPPEVAAAIRKDVDRTYLSPDLLPPGRDEAGRREEVVRREAEMRGRLTEVL